MRCSRSSCYCKPATSARAPPVRDVRSLQRGTAPPDAAVAGSLSGLLCGSALLFLVLLLLRWRRRRAATGRNDVQLTALRGSYTRDWRARRCAAPAPSRLSRATPDLPRPRRLLDARTGTDPVLSWLRDAGPVRIMPLHIASTGNTARSGGLAPTQVDGASLRVSLLSAEVAAEADPPPEAAADSEHTSNGGSDRVPTSALAASELWRRRQLPPPRRPPDAFRHDVFLSYRHSDLPLADAMERALVAAGLTVFRARAPTAYRSPNGRQFSTTVSPRLAARCAGPGAPDGGPAVGSGTVCGHPRVAHAVPGARCRLYASPAHGATRHSLRRLRLRARSC